MFECVGDTCGAVADPVDIFVGFGGTSKGEADTSEVSPTFPGYRRYFWGFPILRTVSVSISETFGFVANSSGGIGDGFERIDDALCDVTDTSKGVTDALRFCGNTCAIAAGKRFGGTCPWQVPEMLVDLSKNAPLAMSQVTVIYQLLCPLPFS